jgi:hypothetical protein
LEFATRTYTHIAQPWPVGLTAVRQSSDTRRRAPAESRLKSASTPTAGGGGRSQLASILANVVRVPAMKPNLLGLRPLRYLTSAIRTLPTENSGIPFVNSSTLFLTQSAASSLEARA